MEQMVVMAKKVIESKAGPSWTADHENSYTEAYDYTNGTYYRHIEKDSGEISYSYEPYGI